MLPRRLEHYKVNRLSSMQHIVRGYVSALHDEALLLFPTAQKLQHLPNEDSMWHCGTMAKGHVWAPTSCLVSYARGQVTQYCSIASQDT